jgi:hypothetical protein
MIENVRSQTGSKTMKGWRICINNGSPHNPGPAQKCVEASRVERLSHPIYSPDLAPNEFFLFEYIKGKLSDDNCESRENLLNATTEIFTGVDQEELPSVFESSVNRLKWVIKHEEEYYTM